MASSGVITLFDLSPETNLEEFTSTTLCPSREYLESCNAVVDRLVHFLQNNVPDRLRPSKVVKSGSLGKGTAVEKLSDVDLILFLKHYRNEEVRTLVENMNQILNELAQYLGSYGECEVMGKTKHSIQVKLSHASHTLDVDILPAVDVLEQLDTKSASRLKVVETIYQKMDGADVDIKDFYSASLAPLQLDFVRKVDTKVKDLIRLVKFWKKKHMKSKVKRWPKSYLLELIVIHCWQQGGRKQNFNLKSGLCAVLEALIDYKHLKAVWYENYSEEEVSFGVKTHYVFDPANPHNDVMAVCDVWEDVAEKAGKLRRSPLLQKVSCDRNRW